MADFMSGIKPSGTKSGLTPPSRGTQNLEERSSRLKPPPAGEREDPPRGTLRFSVFSTMKLFSVLGVALLLSAVGAQVPHWGPCPDPAVQPAFSLKQFTGRWFEIAKLPAQFEKGRCIETNFTMTTESSVRVVSSEILKGERRRMEGTGVVEDLKNPAKLGISYSYVLPYSPYWILSTDYVSTALVYSCTDVLRLFHVDFAWILARTRTLPQAAVEKAREEFLRNNIDVSRMVPSRQQGCDKTL